MMGKIGLEKTKGMVTELKGELQGRQGLTSLSFMMFFSKFGSWNQVDSTLGWEDLLFLRHEQEKFDKYVISNANQKQVGERRMKAKKGSRG